jgi:uncharacterized membrane protein
MRTITALFSLVLVSSMFSCASSDKVSRKVTSEESKEKVVEQDVNVKNDALMKRHLRNFELRVGN